jgi:hypothetical protein
LRIRSCSGASKSHHSVHFSLSHSSPYNSHVRRRSDYTTRSLLNTNTQPATHPLTSPTQSQAIYRRQAASFHREGLQHPRSGHRTDTGKMAEIAQRVLMNEFKQLSKEKWTNIEVSRGSITSYVPQRKRHMSPQRGNRFECPICSFWAILSGEGSHGHLSGFRCGMRVTIGVAIAVPD